MKAKDKARKTSTAKLKVVPETKSRVVLDFLPSQLRPATPEVEHALARRAVLIAVSESKGKISLQDVQRLTRLSRSQTVEAVQWLKTRGIVLDIDLNVIDLLPELRHFEKNCREGSTWKIVQDGDQLMLSIEFP